MNAGGACHSFFISIGSNLHPQKYIPACLEILKNEFKVKKISSIYETEPVGSSGPNLFWNLAVEIETPLDPENLIQKLREIEARLGRNRDPQDKFAARTLDLDLLPQKDYQRQAFMMIPLAEISPDAMDEASGKSFQELAEGLKSEGNFFRVVGQTG